MDVFININGNGILEMLSPLKSYLLSTDFLSLNQKDTVPVEKTNFCGSSVLWFQTAVEKCDNDNPVEEVGREVNLIFARLRLEEAICFQSQT